MNSDPSKGRRACTARGVTFLSLLASTVSFASVAYVGPEAARVSLGVDRSFEHVMPGPQEALAGVADARPTNSAMPPRAASAAGLARIGGMAIGLPADEAVEISRMAPLVVPPGDEAANAMSGVRRVLESTRRPCLPATFVLSSQDVDDVLHPVIDFLVQGPDVGAMMKWLRGAGVDQAARPGALTCAIHDQGATLSFADEKVRSGTESAIWRR